MAEGLFTDGVLPGPNDVIIALMGMTGAGKSSLIALCSDKKPEIGHDLDSCTQSVNTYSFVYPGPPRKTVFLIDTPGFDDSSRSDTEILRQLAAWLADTFSKNLRLTGMVYLHRINQPRMQGSARRNIRMFKKLCGDEALKNVILATTMWDMVSEKEGAAREKQILETPELWGYMAGKGSVAYRHLNTYDSAMKLISHFIEAEPVVLDIQHEMVVEHKQLDSTAAGATVEALLKQQEAHFTEELRNLQEELREALRIRDQDSSEALEGEVAKNKADLAQIKEAHEKLRVDMEKLLQQQQEKRQETTKEKMQEKKQETKPSPKNISIGYKGREEFSSQEASSDRTAGKPKTSLAHRDKPAPSEQSPTAGSVVKRGEVEPGSIRFSDDGRFFVVRSKGMVSFWSTEQNGPCRWVRESDEQTLGVGALNKNGTIYAELRDDGCTIVDTQSGESAFIDSDGKISERGEVMCQRLNRPVNQDIVGAMNMVWNSIIAGKDARTPCDCRDSRLAIQQETGDLEIWDTQKGQKLPTTSLTTHWPMRVYGIRWSYGETSLLTMADPISYVCNTTTGQRTLLDDSKVSQWGGSQWSVDNKLIFSAIRVGEITIWDAITGAVRARISKGTTTPCEWKLSFDGTMLAYRPVSEKDEPPFVIFIDSSIRRVLPDYQGGPCRNIIWLGGEKKLVVVQRNETLLIWDIPTNKVLDHNPHLAPLWGPLIKDN